MMTDLLRARLATIDAECESAAKIELEELFDNSQAGDTKFRIPSPQAAEAVWLKLIARKEREFIQEIVQVLKARPAVLSKEGASSIKAAIEDAFTDSRYLEKMQDFYREVAEKALSHESSFDMDAKRMDLLDSTYRMGIVDALRKARRSILAEVEPYKQAGAPADAGFLSQWHHYSNLSPWRSITTIVLLSLTSYLIAFIIASDTFRQLMERFGWAGGSGL
ncbi:MAG: hypothetical protein ABI167_11060 [Nitrosospira sp.]